MSDLPDGYRYGIPHNPTPGNIAEGTRLARSTQDLIKQLVEAQLAADAREIKMLFWTRVAGIGAVAALAVSLTAIVVTLLVA